MILALLWQPHPPVGDVADDGLAAVVNMDVLDGDLLLALAAVSLERLDLGGEGAGQFVEPPLPLCRSAGM